MAPDSKDCACDSLVPVVEKPHEAIRIRKHGQVQRAESAYVCVEVEGFGNDAYAKALAVLELVPVALDGSCGKPLLILVAQEDIGLPYFLDAVAQARLGHDSFSGDRNPRAKPEWVALPVR
ncbi:hypothetical protein SAMN04489726_7289 [Allokutzneria albata]|uniref:Uncharacterized protein n=1 Tax=Allokutzneria albata TaxID=211114 RepID=A0A1H0CL77_ALLAB|nr:hypothetical protein SAMN04489726_7289 [Allokutzneria albata]